MEMKEPSEYAYRLEVVESVDDCSCGGSHNAGDTLYGCVQEPTQEMTASVRAIHSDVEFEQVSDE